MNKFPKVISDIVKNDLCIGCGLCVYKCPTQALKMKWNENGFLVPDLFGNCDLNGLCISVCPFNLNPDNEVKTENELTQLFIDSNFEFHSKIGRYIGLYAGFSNDYRLSSSSGGIATYILLELLEKGIVDYIITVNESNIEKTFYEYSILSSKSEILNASKTKYFPVTLASVMQQINELQGKVAVVGVACFIKAIRLTLYKEPTLNEKIIFLVGIICGGVKSRYFTDYLASKTGVFHGDFTKPQYRVKDLNSTAIDYSFRCIGKKDNIENTIKMSSVGDMWGTGLFKNNACDFCDDVTTELSDISIGDAWIDPYKKDGAGTNLIITRSLTADKLIRDGISKGKLQIDSIDIKMFLASQQGSFNHRQKGLSFRMEIAKKKNKLVPTKRFENEKINIYFKIVQLLRMKVRESSFLVWKKNKNAETFDVDIKKYLKLLRLSTIIYHYYEIFYSKMKNRKK